MTSLKLLSLAHSSTNDSNDDYRLQLRYFGGMGSGGNENQQQTSHRQRPENQIANRLSQFFSSRFSHREAASIDDCVRKARTLYIVAYTDVFVEVGGNKARREEYVAAINFAKMGNHGFWVNWLATSQLPITDEKFGQEFKYTACTNNWQCNHFALFLLLVTNLAVQSRLEMENELTDNYCVALQARTSQDEHAHRFYSKYLFHDNDTCDSAKEQDDNIYPGFSTIMQKHQNSTTDFMHFISNASEVQQDLVVFKNDGGVFLQKPKYLLKVDQQFCDEDNKGILRRFVFPFSARRHDIMSLGSGLDFYFVPLQATKEPFDFVIPTEDWQPTSVTVINKDEIDQLSEDPTCWVMDATMDLFINWYVTSSNAALLWTAVLIIDCYAFTY
jgi:hypothetical protein